MIASRGEHAAQRGKLPVQGAPGPEGDQVEALLQAAQLHLQHPDVGQPQQRHHVAQESGLARGAFQQHETRVLQEQGQGQAGEAGAAAHVQHRPARGEAGEHRQPGQRVQEVAHHQVVSGGLHEPVAPVPQLQLQPVALQGLQAGRRAVDGQAPQALRQQAPRAALPRFPAPAQPSFRSRISSTARSEERTPAMREAWPRESGRMRWSLSRASLERPGAPA